MTLDIRFGEGVEIREGSGKLIRQLDPISGDPTPGDDGHTIHMSNVGCRKQTRQHITRKAPDQVKCSNIKPVVNPQQKLQFGSEITTDARNNANQRSKVDRNISASRRNR